jgi:hypothetical protein
MIYRISDEDTDQVTVVNTEKAQKAWEETTRFDGSNRISRATGSQWEHETLYRSAKGRYYVEHVSQWQGSTPYAKFVAPEDAARWLLIHDHPLPEDLSRYETDVSE